jgi:hypothetical protein
MTEWTILVGCLFSLRRQGRRRKEPRNNPALYVRERPDYSACVWEVTFLVEIFLIKLSQVALVGKASPYRGLGLKKFR